MPARPLDLSLLLPPPADEGPVAPAGLFGNDQPVELEIGCGKGAFVLAAAAARPQHNFLALEWANKYACATADRLARHGRTNARVLRTDAGEFIARLPDACLAALHLYHPDPWPKKRHHKRRLVQDRFVRHAARVLAPGGRWLIQTDHDGYAAWIHEHLERPAARAWFEPVPFALDLPPRDLPVQLRTAAPPAGDSPATNWEIKFRRRGSTIHQLAVRRTTAPLADPPSPA